MKKMMCLGLILLVFLTACTVEKSSIYDSPEKVAEYLIEKAAKPPFKDSQGHVFPLALTKIDQDWHFCGGHYTHAATPIGCGIINSYSGELKLIPREDGLKALAGGDFLCMNRRWLNNSKPKEEVICRPTEFPTDRFICDKQEIRIEDIAEIRDTFNEDFQNILVNPCYFLTTLNHKYGKHYRNKDLVISFEERGGSYPYTTVNVLINFKQTDFKLKDILNSEKENNLYETNAFEFFTSKISSYSIEEDFEKFYDKYRYGDYDRFTLPIFLCKIPREKSFTAPDLPYNNICES